MFRLIFSFLSWLSLFLKYEHDSYFTPLCTHCIATCSQTTKDDSSTTTDSDEEKYSDLVDDQVAVDCQDEKNGSYYVENMMIGWRKFSVIIKFV